MTDRERKIATGAVGALIGTAVVGLVGYLLVFDPLMTKASQNEALQKEIDERETKLSAMRLNEKRMKDTLKRSLPADPEVARQEYDAAINRLLREARVPVAAFSVKHKAADSKPAPEISPKKPAFIRIALEITLKPINYATLLDVLQRYYRLNLLQQITRFTVKKIEGSTARPRGSSTLADRADLEVTLVTEAIILDGAENRRSLLPVPYAVGAAAGGAAYHTVMSTPEPSRGLNPLQLAQIVAEGNRDYTLMLVKDIFHGPPVPPVAIPPKREEVVAVAPPKEDTSAYIRLTGFGRNSDGTGTAFIEDAASRQEYLIEVALEKGKPEATVTKFYYTLKGAKKNYAPEPVLDISESSSGTAKLFRVVGLDGEGVLLALKDAAPTEATPAPAPKSTGGQPSKKGSGGGPPRVPTPPAAALVGGSLMSQPQEKYYLWVPGDTLKAVLEKQLSPGDAVKALARIAGNPPPKESTPIAAPMPRETPDAGR